MKSISRILPLLAGAAAMSEMAFREFDYSKPSDVYLGKSKLSKKQKKSRAKAKAARKARRKNRK